MWRAQLQGLETRVFLPEEGGGLVGQPRGDAAPPPSLSRGLRILFLGSKLNLALGAIPFAILSQCVAAKRCALATTHHPRC